MLSCSGLSWAVVWTLDRLTAGFADSCSRCADAGLFERFSLENFPDCFKEYADLLDRDAYWHTILDTSDPPFSSFATMMRELTGRDLHAWCTAVGADNLPALHSLADGFLRDEAAVTAGLSLPWSSGAVEGAVTRIIMWNPGLAPA